VIQPPVPSTTTTTSLLSFFFLGLISPSQHGRALSATASTSSNNLDRSRVVVGAAQTPLETPIFSVSFYKPANRRLLSPMELAACIHCFFFLLRSDVRVHHRMLRSVAFLDQPRLFLCFHHDSYARKRTCNLFFLALLPCPIMYTFSCICLDNLR
jgi:hypothetical protein